MGALEIAGLIILGVVVLFFITAFAVEIADAIILIIGIVFLCFVVWGVFEFVPPNILGGIVIAFLVLAGIAFFLFKDTFKDM